jgi:hypothetical protein
LNSELVVGLDINLERPWLVSDNLIRHSISKPIALCIVKRYFLDFCHVEHKYIWACHLKHFVLPGVSLFSCPVPLPHTCQSSVYRERGFVRLRVISEKEEAHSVLGSEAALEQVRHCRHISFTFHIPHKISTYTSNRRARSHSSCATRPRNGPGPHPSTWHSPWPGCARSAPGT